MKTETAAIVIASLAFVGCGGNPAPDASELGVPGQPVYANQARSDADLANAEPPPPVPGDPAPVKPAPATRSLFDGQDDSEIVAGLTSILKSFQGEMQKAPASLEELVKFGFLDAVPKAPEGKQYVINSESLEVSLKTL